MALDYVQVLRESLPPPPVKLKLNYENASWHMQKFVSHRLVPNYMKLCLLLLGRLCRHVIQPAFYGISHQGPSDTCYQLVSKGRITGYWLHSVLHRRRAVSVPCKEWSLTDHFRSWVSVRPLQSGGWVGHGLQPSDPHIRMRGGFRNCSLSVGQKVNPFCMTPSCPTPHHDLFTLTRKGDNLAKLKFTEF